MKSILYVEDDKINALIIRKMLQGNYDIEIAIDGQSCLNMLDNKHFDLILMDINLGNDKMDGIQTMNEVKKKLGNKAPKIIAVTAFAMPEDQKKFLNLGFNAYISKPIDEQVLVNLIEQFIV